MTLPRLGRTKKSHAVREWLLAAVRQGADHLVSSAVERFGLTRQAIHKHLTWLVENDYLVAEGATRSRTYRLGDHRVFQQTYPLDSIDEHTVHQRDFSFIFQGFLGSKITLTSNQALIIFLLVLRSF